MDEKSGWRNKLSALVLSIERIWALKSRLALGVTMASVTALGALPARTAEASVGTAEVAQASVNKPGKLAGKFLLQKAAGSNSKTFADHRSHSSHSSHRSHASHRSGALFL
jgi:hypothetical protein